MISRFSEKLSLNSGLERLFIFSAAFGIFIHVMGCLYVLLADIEKDVVELTWIDQEELDFDETFSGRQLYILAIYFTVTTMTTVGYGDISATNTYERLFCIVLMFVGVSCFTFISGALSSILSNYDQSQAAYQEKLLHLNKLRM